MAKIPEIKSVPQALVQRKLSTLFKYAWRLRFCLILLPQHNTKSLLSDRDSTMLDWQSYLWNLNPMENLWTQRQIETVWWTCSNLVFTCGNSICYNVILTSWNFGINYMYNHFFMLKTYILTCWKKTFLD